MDYAPSPEMQMLVGTVRKFVDEEVLPFEAEAERMQGIPEGLRAVREKAMQLGLFATGMPVEVGGGGLNHVESCLVEEQFGRAPGPLVRYVFGSMFSILLASKGGQREKYLLPSVRGERLGAIAITEAGAGSDAGNIRTTATRDGDGWLLKGEKHFITDGDIADFIIVMARTPGEQGGDKSMTAFLVDKDTAGFSVGPRQRMMGHRSGSQVELVFDDCRLGPDQVLGEIGAGFAPILRTVSRARLVTIGARSVGLAQRLLEMARNYANDRQQFGQKIGDFQMIQALIADMSTDIFAARSMLYNAAWEMDQGLDPRAKVSMVKLFASEALGRVVDSALQIFGGMGYSTDLPVERMYRDARVARIWEGTSEIQRRTIARAVLKSGLNLDGMG